MSRAAKKRAKRREKNERGHIAAEEDDSKEAESKKQRLDCNEDDLKNPPIKSILKKTARKEEEKVMATILKQQDGDGDSTSGEEADDDDIVVSFPNMSLVEILLLKESNNQERTIVLGKLTAQQRAAALFQAMIDPIPLDEFYAEYWEKKPLLVRAQKQKQRYDGLLSLESIKKLSKTSPLYYGRDLNVTRYQKDAQGVKRRINLDKLPKDENEKEAGVLVNNSELWAQFDKGCTIRLLCPHKLVDSVHSLLSTLEIELGCMVGANAYLTPSNSSQGFAPHYDDIEAFCMQLEGTKHWKVYEPVLKLPRVSSEDFTADDLIDKVPVLDVTLEQGDLLYMPRGWIHQATTLKDSSEHSLHLTVSAMQQWSWADLLDIVVPEALEAETMSNTSTLLRQGLPRGFLDYMGAMHDASVDENLPDALKNVDNDANEDDEKQGKAKSEKLRLRRRELLQEKFRQEAKKRIMKVALTVSGCSVWKISVRSHTLNTLVQCRPARWWMRLAMKWERDSNRNVNHLL